MARQPKEIWPLAKSETVVEVSPLPARTGHLKNLQISLREKIWMPRHDPFDVISSAVDLDDPAEHDNAQRFMVKALTRVIECLPVTAQSAALTAKQYLEGAATAGEVSAVRVELWKGIQGRDQSDEHDVLRIRTTICALHGMDAEAPCDKLEYFLKFWERGGLSMVELAEAILDGYGVVYQVP